MKALVLTSVLALLSLTSVSAQKMYTNVDKNDSGSVKECTFVNDETLSPEAKTVYVYDESDNLLDKTVYTWDNQKGWVGVHKYDYEYNRSGVVSNLVYTKWNKQLSAWSTKSQHYLHIYDLNGEFLSVKHIEVNNDVNLMAGK